LIGTDGPIRRRELFIFAVYDNRLILAASLWLIERSLENIDARNNASGTWLFLPFFQERDLPGLEAEFY
jgi:hypothetical protein